MSFTRAVIYPYNMGSASAKALAEALDTFRVRTNGKYRPRVRDLIINWGNRGLPSWYGKCRHMVNTPQYVENASAKDKTFSVLEQNGLQEDIVPWTKSMKTAEGWLTGKPLFPGALHAVVVRKLTRANSGRGIVLAKEVSQLEPAPLYTAYKPKKKEYRVHVFNGAVIDVVEKKRKHDHENPDKYIRNHPNGWVFCREGVKAPEVVETKAIQAVAALRLHFGAVDIGYHPGYGVSIYEINTAPGIEGQTVKSYADAIRAYQSNS